MWQALRVSLEAVELTQRFAALADRREGDAMFILGSNKARRGGGHEFGK